MKHLPSVISFIVVAFCASLAMGALVLIYAALNEEALTISVLKENLIGGGSFFMFLSLLFLVGKLAGRVPSFTNLRRVEKSYPTGGQTGYTADYYLFAILLGSLFILAIGLNL